MQEIWVQFLGRKDPLEKGTTTHSSVLAWRIPWTEEPGGLPCITSQRVGHDWNNSACTQAASSLPACSSLCCLFLAVSLISLCFFMRKSNMNSDYWKEDISSSFSNLKLRDLEFKKSDADFKVSALNWHCDTTLDRNEGMGTNIYSEPPTQSDGSPSLCTGALFTSHLLLHRETEPQSSSHLPKFAQW